MKLYVFLVAVAVFCAALSQAAIPLSFHSVDPDSFEIHWEVPVKVAGLQLKLGNRDHFTYTNVAQGPALPSSWSASDSLTTGAIVAFSLSGAEANNNGDNDGKVFEVSFEPSLGTLELESCLVTDKTGQEVACTLPTPVEIAAPTLEFEVTAISAESVTLGYTLSGWHKVTRMEFEVDGMHMASFESDEDITCTKTGSNGQMVCVGHNIGEGSNQQLITFNLTPNSGGRSFEMINTQFDSERPAFLTFDVTLPAVAYVPKIAIGIESITAVDASTETCGSGPEACAAFKNEVRIMYQNLDAAVLIAGFEFTLEGDVTWLDSSLAEGIHGFSLSGNDNGKFVCFSMQGSEIPASTAGATLFVAHIDNKLQDAQLTLKDVVLSDRSGMAIAANILNFGLATIEGCDQDDDGYCDLEDADCDCCLNNVDTFPENELAGCGFCSDLDDNKEVDIVDVIRTVNMWQGTEAADVLKGNANGGNPQVIDSADVLIAVDMALNDPEDQDLKSRPCLGEA